MDDFYSILTMLISGYLIRYSLIYSGQLWAKSFSQTVSFFILPIITFIITKTILDSLTSGYMTIVIVNMLKKLKVKFAKQNPSIAVFGIIITAISLNSKIILILKHILTDGEFYISLIQVGTH